MRAAALADERAFVPYDWMAGYGAVPTLERLTDDACEQRFVAALCPRGQRSLHAVTSAPHKQRSIRESEYPCSASRRLTTSVRNPGYNYRHAGVAGCRAVGARSSEAIRPHLKGNHQRRRAAGRPGFDVFAARHARQRFLSCSDCSHGTSARRYSARYWKPRRHLPRSRGPRCINPPNVVTGIRSCGNPAPPTMQT